MRSIVFVLALMLTAVPAVHAQQSQAVPANHPATQTQQLAAPVAAPALNLRPVHAPVGFARSDATLEAREVNSAAEKAAAFQEGPSARTVLAIIGAVVVVVALIAFLN